MILLLSIGFILTVVFVIIGMVVFAELTDNKITAMAWGVFAGWLLVVGLMIRGGFI